MKKKILPLIMLIGVSATQLSCSSKKEPDKPAVIVNPQESELPQMALTEIDGKQFSAKNLIGQKNFFILFQPDCEHCQKEAQQISERLPAFKNYEIYFISSAPLDAIKKFSEDFKMNTQKNIHFVGTDVQNIIDSYGPIPAPSIYIYSEQGKLLNKFNGEIEIDSVLKQLTY